MAITRTQIARQLYNMGGGQFDSSKGGGPASPGTSESGKNRGGTGGGRDTDFQQRGMSKAEYNAAVRDGTLGGYEGSPKEPPQLRDDERFIPTPVTGKSFIDNIRDDIYQFGINRNKVAALRGLGFLNKPSRLGFIGPLAQSLETVPEYADDTVDALSNKELIDIATTGPYLSNQKTKGDVAAFERGKDLLGRVDKAQKQLDKGFMNQSSYDDFFPGPDVPKDTGGDGGQLILPPVLAQAPRTTEQEEELSEL